MHRCLLQPANYQPLCSCFAWRRGELRRRKGSGHPLPHQCKRIWPEQPSVSLKPAGFRTAWLSHHLSWENSEARVSCHSAEFPGCVWDGGGVGLSTGLLLQFTCISQTAAALLQSCPALRDPKDGSPPGSPIPGILQARSQTTYAQNLVLGSVTQITISPILHRTTTAVSFTKVKVDRSSKVRDRQVMLDFCKMLLMQQDYCANLESFRGRKVPQQPLRIQNIT